jgi:hypothetical protein
LTTLSLWQKAAPTTSATSKRFANAVTAAKAIGSILGLIDGFANQSLEWMGDNLSALQQTTAQCIMKVLSL